MKRPLDNQIDYFEKNPIVFLDISIGTEDGKFYRLHYSSYH